MPLTVNVGYSRKLGRPDFGSVGARCHVECERSAKKWGGEPQDYLAIHRWIDQVKSQLGDNRHRAVLLHNAWGIHLAADVFGDFITNSAGKRVLRERDRRAACDRGPGVHPRPERMPGWLEAQALDGRGALKTLSERVATPRTRSSDEHSRASLNKLLAGLC
jgi:hypothetical protein